MADAEITGMLHRHFAIGGDAKVTFETLEIRRPEAIAPTNKQMNKLNELKRLGYVWNVLEGVTSPDVVMEKDGDRWMFALDGSIKHLTESEPKNTENEVQ